MRHVLLLAGLALLGLAWTATAGDKGKGTKVTIDGASSTTPSDWTAVKLPARSMRFAQFRLPAAEGEKEKAEVAIFKLGGSAKANVERWQNQFSPAKGKVTELKVGGHPATQLDITGTYKAPPFDPTFKGNKEDFRLVGIQIDGDNTWQIKLLGPAKTVEKHKKAFDAWIKSFKK
jgi:hypothetical protein